MAQTQNTWLQMVQTQISGNCAAFCTSDSLLSLSLIGVEGMILQSLCLESWIQILIRSQKAGLSVARVKKSDWHTVQENPNMKLVSDSTGNGWGEQYNQGIISLYSCTVPVRAESFLFFHTDTSTKIICHLLSIKRFVTWKSFSRGKLNVRAKISNFLPVMCSRNTTQRKGLPNYHSEGQQGSRLNGGFFV